MLAERERIVAPEREARRTHRVDEETQRARVVHERVEVEAPHLLAWVDRAVDRAEVGPLGKPVRNGNSAVRQSSTSVAANACASARTNDPYSAARDSCLRTMRNRLR